MEGGKDLLDFDIDEIIKKQPPQHPAAASAPVPAVQEPIAAPPEDDSGKKHVIVKFEGQEHYVSWYDGTPANDVLEAIMCTCDCILETGFELIDSDGKTVDFHHVEAIRSGETYHLYKGEELKEFKKVLGDRWRKVKIAVEPLRHAEAQRAIEIMQMGANLLKYTGKGTPHIRQFQLSSDMKRIMWYCKSKPQVETYIDLATVTNVWVGGQDPALIKKTLPMLANISFTMVYTNSGTEKRMHITCKDEQEFDLWVCGIKALSYHFKGIAISKLELLSHSRQFNQKIESKQVGEATKVFFEENKGEKPSKSLEDYIIRKVRSKEELRQICKRVGDKLIGLQDEVDEATESLNVEPESKMEGYRVLTAKESEADDSTQLRSRMNELLETCGRGTKEASAELDAVKEEEGKDEEYEKKLKAVDAKLWKIEIDMENVADMIKRIKMQSNLTWKEQFKNWFPKIF